MCSGRHSGWVWPVTRSRAHARSYVPTLAGHQAPRRPVPSGSPVPKVNVKTPPIRKERRVTVTDQVELPRVYMAWITNPIFKPGDAETDLLAQILGGGKSSRLYKRLVYDKRIAQDVIAHQHSLSLGSVFYIQATAKPGISPEELEQEIDKELEAIRTEGVTDAELERARNTI